METLCIIAGLGNPGRQYEGTRHNVGFAVIDALAGEATLFAGDRRPARFCKSLALSGRIEGRRVLLLKPQTYVNASGEAIREAVAYYKADPASQLIVVSDDINLEAGRLRIRTQGSAGGHNGLKSIIQHLGSEAFCRVRVGVGAKPSPDYDLADYVLGHFAGEDRERMACAERLAAEAVCCILREGVEVAMNRYNGKAPEREQAQEKPDQGTPDRAARS